MPDEIFENPRLAAIYDTFDAVRDDLDHYLTIVHEFSARSVLDIGCGTGSFPTLLTAHGIEVIGADPAAASLDIARSKPGADAVRWIHGDANVLASTEPPIVADMAVMTGNVAMVFLDDADWLSTLAAIRSALTPAGRLVFEVRDPAHRGWEAWTREQTLRRVDVPGIGVVEKWVEVTDVSSPFVTFESGNVFESDGDVIMSTSTLRFRSRREVEASLTATGFAVDEVRDAPDRPGKEFVFIASVANRRAASRIR